MVKNTLKWTGVFLTGGVVGYLLSQTDIGRVVDERRAEVLGHVASSYVASQTQIDTRNTVKTVAGLNLIEIAVDRPVAGVFRASGVGNTFLINTPEGNVLFDTGLGTQAARHKRLLQNSVEGPIKYIILSHSHADHIGGAKFWLAEFPDAEVVTHARFRDGQRYLDDLEMHFWDRNRLLYTFMPEEPPTSGPVVYGGIEPTIEVSDGDPFEFTLGSTEFVVLPAPGAEGDDNLVLWLPDLELLFTGDFFGPLFPMVPNLFTLRGEKFRDPLAYVQSLDTLIDLQPAMVLPGHFDPIKGRERIRADMRKMRDATQYIHDATVQGMNAGKSVWELMSEIRLPPHLVLSEGHGKVSWNVRSIWEHYSTWFHFESTTELYPVPVRTLYADMAELAGGAEKLVAKARRSLDEGEVEAALHWVEIGLSANPDHAELLAVRLNALNWLLQRAYAEGSNYSETGWLKARIRMTQSALDRVLGRE